LKKIRYRVLQVAIWALGTGIVFERTITEYRKSPTNLDGGYILLCGVSLCGLIFLISIIWVKIKELEPHH